MPESVRAWVIRFVSVQHLAAKKGLTAERHPWRDRVRLVCRNGAPLGWYLEGYGRLTAFGLRHALKFLRELPDVD
jgi:hypothetical protein